MDSTQGPDLGLNSICDDIDSTHLETTVNSVKFTMISQEFNRCEACMTIVSLSQLTSHSLIHNPTQKCVKKSTNIQKEIETETANDCSINDKTINGVKFLFISAEKFRCSVCNQLVGGVLLVAHSKFHKSIRKFPSKLNPDLGIDVYPKNQADTVTIADCDFVLTNQDKYKCDKCKQLVSFVLLSAHANLHKNELDHSVQSKTNISENLHSILNNQNEFPREKEKIQVPKDKLLPVVKRKPAVKKRAKKTPELEEDEYSYSSLEILDVDHDIPPDSDEDIPMPSDSSSSFDSVSKIRPKEEDEDTKEPHQQPQIHTSSDESELSSSSGDSTMNHAAIIMGRKEKGVKGYRCDCNGQFPTYKKFKKHTSVKKSKCKRCKEIMFCRETLKKHTMDCIRKRVKNRYGFRNKKPHPRYLRAIEEVIRKKYAVMDENYKNSSDEEESRTFYKRYYYRKYD